MTNGSNESIPWTHDLIENRFDISSDITEQAPEGGSWQILDNSELVIRHELITGHRYLAYPINPDVELEPDTCSWQNNGIESCYVDTLRPSDSRPYLLVTTTSLQNHELFTDLIHYLLISGVNTPNVILQRMRIMQAWWGSPIPPLSDEAAAGLFGELFFLSRQLNGSWENKISAWDGPDSALNDFNWAEDLGLHVEVKTTRGFEEPLVHTVSSLHQLSVQAGHHLALFSLSARPDPGGDESLHEMIDEILNELGELPLVHEEFVNKLAESGWAPNSNEFRYIVDDDLIRMYIVDDNFPRLTNTDVNGIELDNRILIRTYQITMQDLDASLLPITSGTPQEILGHLQ